MRAIMSFAAGLSSTTSPGARTSPHLRKNSWLRRWNNTSRLVIENTTSLTLNVVGFGKSFTPCWFNTAWSATETRLGVYSRRAHLWQPELGVLGERALRVRDVRAREISRTGDHDHGRARRALEEGREARRDLVAEQLRGRLVDVARLDQRVVPVNKGSELFGVYGSALYPREDGPNPGM